MWTRTYQQIDFRPALEREQGIRMSETHAGTTRVELENGQTLRDARVRLR